MFLAGTGRMTRSTYLSVMFISALSAGRFAVPRTLRTARFRQQREKILSPSRLSVFGCRLGPLCESGGSWSLSRHSEQVGLAEFRFQPDVFARSRHRPGRTHVGPDSLPGSAELVRGFVSWALHDPRL